MKLSLKILAIVLVGTTLDVMLTTLGAAPARAISPATQRTQSSQLTPDQAAQYLQMLIDVRYRSAGGACDIPEGDYDIGTTPLHLYSAVKLRGQDSANTTIRYSGKGPEILLDEYGLTHNGHNNSAVRQLNLVSSDQGIGFAPNQVDVEASDVTIADCNFTTNGTAVALGKTQRLTYKIRLDHLHTVSSPDLPAIDLSNAIQYDVAAVNAMTPANVAPRLIASGVMQKCIVCDKTSKAIAGGKQVAGVQ